MSRRMRKQQFAYAKTKALTSEADQCLCFRYTDSTIPLLLESKITAKLACAFVFAHAHTFSDAGAHINKSGTNAF